MNHVAAIVLAAGKGTRMKSENKNKVVLEIEKKPMVSYTVENLKKADIDNIIVVIGFASQSVKQVLGDQVTYAFQPERLGTGHAVNIGLSKVPDNVSDVISVYGDDSAFYPPKLIKELLNLHQDSNAAITLLTIEKQDPTGLGRIVRNEKGAIQAIVEEAVATPKQKKIKEINTGLYCFDKDFLDKSIDLIKKNPVSGEYYLTDLIEIAVEKGLPVKALFWEDDTVWHGINTIDQLKSAQKLMRQRV
jgi:bifunctional UDP-N-acetylglucosamine pyrophosphorylase/glucosamine-1-phosphate N-acetyltransferase